MNFFVRPLALIGLLCSLLAAGPLQAYTHKGTGKLSDKLTITSGGLTREYYVYVPNSYQPGKPVPLVFNMHGITMDGLWELEFADLSAIADTANFLLVLPNGTINQDPVNKGNRCWNTFGTGSKVDDVGFISDLLTSLQSQYSIDANRVYATGFSNGAFMSYVLACQLGNRIAAVASVSGAMVKSQYNACAPQHPTPVLDIHGDADQKIYYNGGFNGVTADPNFYSTPTVLAYWAGINKCTSSPVVTLNANGTIERSVWSSGSYGSTVLHYKVIGGGHDWPMNSNINTSQEVWSFLRQFRLDHLQGKDTPPATVAPNTPNLALNKLVTVSSTQKDLSGKELLGSAAADGNATTRWVSAATDQEWLYVDLGARYNVNEVKITWAADYGKNYDVEVSADAKTWTLLKSVTNNTALVNDLTGLSGTGRYVRMNDKVSATKWGYSIFELEVYGTLAANLALNKPVTVSSNENTTLLPALAVDGNTTTRWASGHTDQEWLYVDLGARYNVNEVKITWETAYGKNYDVEVSADAKTWTLLKSVTNNTALVNDLTGSSGTGRYVRMNGKARATQWGYSIFELEVYGTLAANLALNKPVTVSSNENTTLLPALAVDGNTTTRWASGHTDQEWLYVDLGARYNVNEVKITWEAAYGKNYDVEVSADAKTWTLLKSVTNNTALVNDLTGSSGTGRYVRMNGKARATQWGYSIFELEVYGTPATGTQRTMATQPTPAEQLAATEQLTVFPNPATATVKLSDVAAFPATADLYDTKGARLHSVQLTQADDTLDVSALGTGLYTIRVKSAQSVQTVRLQKN